MKYITILTAWQYLLTVFSSKYCDNIDNIQYAIQQVLIIQQNKELCIIYVNIFSGMYKEGTIIVKT